MIEITSPVGRIVSGHPMKYNPKKDDNNQPVTRDGQAVKEAFFALAIPKNQGETHWNQTAWGQQVQAEAVRSWPAGETAMPVFSWKITDGDSTVPNRKMKRPVDREGYAGHWVIAFSTELPIACYHPEVNGNFPVMQTDVEIKCGDYVRVHFSVKDNKPKNGVVKTPGVYVNPKMVLLISAGVAIIGADMGDPTAAFGGAPSQLPQGAQIDHNPAPMPAPVTQAFQARVETNVTPNQEFLNPPMPPQSTAATPPPPAAPAPKRVLSNGYTASQLQAAGWSDAQIASLG